MSSSYGVFIPMISARQDRPVAFFNVEEVIEECFRFTSGERVVWNCNFMEEEIVTFLIVYQRFKFRSKDATKFERNAKFFSTVHSRN